MRKSGAFWGVDRGLKTILIGAGNLGRAIATHMSFEARGFNLIGIFDKNEAMAGQLVRGLPVRHVDGLDDFCRDQKPMVAVLCISSDNAPEIIAQLVKLGIKGFLELYAFRYCGTLSGCCGGKRAFERQPDDAKLSDEHKVLTVSFI